MADRPVQHAEGIQPVSSDAIDATREKLETAVMVW
jgi:hypothetical protein